MSLRLAVQFLLALAVTADYVSVRALFEPPAAGGADAAIVVTLTPKQADIRVNENPAPRLRLAEGQSILFDRQPPASRPRPVVDPTQAKYLDPSQPLRFAVAVAPKAPKGQADVAATLTFFYCSKGGGWCRKGTADVTVKVDVR
jgi:hypothetical protein